MTIRLVDIPGLAKTRVTHAVATTGVSKIIPTVAKLVRKFNPLVKSGTNWRLATRFFPGSVVSQDEITFDGSGTEVSPSDATTTSASHDMPVNPLIGLEKCARYADETALLLGTVLDSDFSEKVQLNPRIDGAPVAFPGPFTEHELGLVFKSDKKYAIQAASGFYNSAYGRLAYELENYFTDRWALGAEDFLSSEDSKTGRAFCIERKYLKKLLETLEGCAEDPYTMEDLIEYFPHATPDGRFAGDSSVARWFSHSKAYSVFRLRVAFAPDSIGTYVRSVERDEPHLPNSQKGWSTRFAMLHRFFSFWIEGYIEFCACIMKRYLPFLDQPGADEMLRKAFGVEYDTIKVLLQKAGARRVSPLLREVYAEGLPYTSSTAWDPETKVYPIDAETYTYINERSDSLVNSVDSKSDSTESLADAFGVHRVTSDEIYEKDKLYRSAVDYAQNQLNSCGGGGIAGLAQIIALTERGLQALEKRMSDSVRSEILQLAVLENAVATRDSSSPLPNSDFSFPVFTDGRRVSEAKLSIRDLSRRCFLPCGSAGNVVTSGWRSFFNIEPLYPLSSDPQRISLYCSGLEASLKSHPTFLWCEPSVPERFSSYSYLGRDPRFLMSSDAFQGGPHPPVLIYSISELMSYLQFGKASLAEAIDANPSVWFFNAQTRKGFLQLKENETRKQLYDEVAAKYNPDGHGKKKLPAYSDISETQLFYWIRLVLGNDKAVAALEIHGRFAYVTDEVGCSNPILFESNRIASSPTMIPYIGPFDASGHFSEHLRDSGVLKVVEVDLSEPSAPYSFDAIFKDMIRLIIPDLPT